MKKLEQAVYEYDEHLTGITRNLFGAHWLTVLPTEKFAPLMDLIRYNAFNNISEDSSSPLSDYLEKAIRYAYLNVHALGIFICGHDLLENFLPCVSDNLDSFDYLPSRYVTDAEKLLIQAVRDYRINIDKLLNDPPTFNEKFHFLTLWLAMNCCDDLPEDFDERDFLSVFHDSAYAFAEFLATYASILTEKKLRPRKGAPQTLEMEVMNYLREKNISSHNTKKTRQ